MKNKAALRNYYSDLRSKLSTDELQERSLAIANNVLKLDIWGHTYFHLFLTIEQKKEVDTQFLLHILQGRDKSIIVSKSNFATAEMEHFLLQENTKLVVSSYGIPEPLDGIPIEPSQLEVVFVPLLAFDKKGHRIGYGKGFYDRFLSTCPKNCLKIGLSLFEAETAVPSTAFDIPLDYCITPFEVCHFI